MLQRLMAPGSDRTAEQWKDNYALAGVDSLALHQLYRTMAWLGEPLPETEPAGATPFVARTTKDRVEEALFSHRRYLFSGLNLVFFDTTSIYLEGDGGQPSAGMDTPRITDQTGCRWWWEWSWTGTATGVQRVVARQRVRREEPASRSWSG